MLNTFFFGYLAKKWKRLIRVLSFLGLAFFQLSEIIDAPAVLVVLLYVNLVSLISWVLKPFITND